VRADPTQIEQVVMNLCLNARDAMPDGGHLLVKTRNIELDEEFCRKNPQARPGRHVILEVTDTGHGIDAATLERIFEPFFTTKGPSKGTGLGLATVYGVVKQHGGLVTVESEVGKGTTFRVYLQVSPESAASSRCDEDGTSSRGGTETILVVEDHEGLRELDREILTNSGYKVLAVTDGEEAIQVFRANAGNIDLALLDVMLPKMSGPEVHSRIRALNENVPILFTSGYSPDAELLKKLEAAGHPLLQKPYSPRELLRKLRETLDRGSVNGKSKQSG